MKKTLICAILSMALLSGCSFKQSGIIKVNDTVITKAEFNKVNQTVKDAKNNWSNQCIPFAFSSLGVMSLPMITGVCYFDWKPENKNEYEENQNTL